MALSSKGKTASKEQEKEVEEDRFREQKASVGMWSYGELLEAY